LLLLLLLENEKDWDGNNKQPNRIKITRKKETDSGGGVDGKFKWQQFVAKLGGTFLACGFMQFNFNSLE
jgi:hypothetical protein